MESCARKQRHPDRKTAVTAVMSLARKRGAVPGQLQVYKCVACGFWHFGHRRRGR